MNAEQKKEVIELISQDCEISFNYLKEGKTCAVGCLALKAGIPHEPLAESRLLIQHEPDFIAAIESRFGLNYSQLVRIQDLNDSHSTPESRRKAIIDYLNKF